MCIRDSPWSARYNGIVTTIYTSRNKAYKITRQINRKYVLLKYNSTTLGGIGLVPKHREDKQKGMVVRDVMQITDTRRIKKTVTAIYRETTHI